MVNYVFVIVMQNEKKDLSFAFKLGLTEMAFNVIGGVVGGGAGSGRGTLSRCFFAAPVV